MASGRQQQADIRMASIRFGTLGAANITPTALLEPASRNADVEVVAIAARSRERAAAMARKGGVRDVVDDYQAVIDHPDVNAVYNPLPISHHREWTLKALAAGKPVLCEKSFALNEREAVEMAEAAERAGLLLIEAFHYRYHPVFLRALELYHAGAIGALRRIEGFFHVAGEHGIPANNIRMNYATGGGATMDMGCYPLSWLRHFTGEEPDVVSASAVEGPPDVDLQLVAELAFPSGATGRASGSMMKGERFRADLVVEGAEGKLTVRNPLVPHLGHEIKLEAGGEATTETRTKRTTYDFQLDAFVRALGSGERLPTDAADAVKQMRLVDSVYRAAGMKVRGT